MIEQMTGFELRQHIWDKQTAFDIGDCGLLKAISNLPPFNPAVWSGATPDDIEIIPGKTRPQLNAEVERLREEERKNAAARTENLPALSAEHPESPLVQTGTVYVGD